MKKAIPPLNDDGAGKSIVLLGGLSSFTSQTGASRFCRAAAHSARVAIVVEFDDERATGSGDGSLSGRVIADSTSRPVAGAIIAIGETGRSALSDSAGVFTTVGIPSGIHIVRVRALGFAPFEQRIRFDSGQRVEVDVALTMLPQTIAGVKVVARPVPSFLKDFDARRRTGMGRFLDTTDIAPYVNSQLATLLTSRVPGVRQVRFGGRTALASSRGNASLKEIPGGDVTDRQLGAPRACYVQIVIDNITLYQGQVDEPLFNADHNNLQAIAAIEFYTVSNRPSEFKRAGGGACGTVVIWTKR